MTTTKHGGSMSNTLVITSPGFIHNEDNGCLPARALYRAQLLIGAVRDERAVEVARLLSDLDRQALVALTVTFAALVPYDQSLRELLAWNDDQWETPRGHRRPRKLRPHGSHAAYTRHKTRGEQPCDECVAGERNYQRARCRKRAR